MFRNQINDVKRISKRIKKTLRVPDIDKKITTKLQPHWKSEPLYKHQDNAVETDDEDSLYQEVSRINCRALDLEDATISWDSGTELANNLTDDIERKMRTDLLRYQLETAQLERQRIQTSHESHRTIAALRLRSARLDAVEKQSRLPANHPALGYTEDEMPAKFYLEKQLM